MVHSKLHRVERGVYTLPDTWKDELYVLQWRFSKGIFSHETALYLLGMTDRTSLRYTMTFPFGYNPSNINKRGVVPKVASEETYSLGIMTMHSPSGNPIQTYEIERTLCDMVKTRHKADISMETHAMRMYAGSKDKEIARLMEYAERLRLKVKALTYIKILL